MERQTADQELAQFKKNFEGASRAKNRAALQGMLHEDFTLIDPSGRIVGKQELIEAICHPNSTFAQSFNRAEHKTVFHVQGNVARETADVIIKGSLRTEDVSGTYVNTVTYVKDSTLAYIKDPAGWHMVGNSLVKKP